MPNNDTTAVPVFMPCLFYRNAPAAITWLSNAFGFQKRLVVEGANGTIEHAEISFGNGVLMLASAKPEKGWFSPLDLTGLNQLISVYVSDPDAHYIQAQQAGAEIVMELKTEDYGARGYLVKDMEGNQWYFGNYIPGAYWDK